MRKNFIISTDSCADMYKSYMEEKNVRCIAMRRVADGREVGGIFDSAEEFDDFYEELKNGETPGTTQLNSYEIQEYFESILKEEKDGDLIHVSLSSGLSGTCKNAVAAADVVNRATGRRVYVVDSLIATWGMGMLVDKLIEMRDAGVETAEAIRQTEYTRDRQQGWVIVGDLFHLKRGGRIGGFKAAVGTLLKIKPVVTLPPNGRLVIENTVNGERKAIRYVIGKMRELGVKAGTDFSVKPVYLVRTSKCALYDDFKQAASEEFPDAVFKERVVGPVIGAHLGGGCAIVLFEGAERLNV